MSGIEEAKTRLLAHVKRRRRKLPEIYYQGAVLLHGERVAFDSFAVHFGEEMEFWRVYPDREPTLEKFAS